MKYLKIIILIFCISHQYIIGQIDTSSVHLEEVEIASDSIQKKNYPTILYHEFSEKEIENSVHSDLGSIVNSMSSVTLKDYGGVGGVKTISVRGFSALHNGVLIHNLPISNSQTGSIDLGQIRSDNIAKIGFAIGSINEMFFPAKSNAYVSTLNITPRELKLNVKKLNVKVTGAYGSFSTFEPYFSINSRVRDKHLIGFNFRYLQSKGNYPFKIDYGYGPIEGVREHASFNSLQGNMGGIHQLKKGKIEYRISYSDQNKELPGAVIYFDSSKSEQKLMETNFDTQLQYKFKNDKWSILSFFNYNYNFTDYQDPNFLNSLGGIHDKYWMNNYYFGATVGFRPLNRMQLLFGADETITTLESNKNEVSNIIRSDLRAVIGLNYSFWRVKIKSNVLLTSISDKNKNAKTFSTTKLNPFISIGVYPIKKSLFHIQFFYKNSLRPPSMNEIYYNQIVKEIQPETAHQFNFGLTYKKENWTLFKDFKIGSQLYMNLVRNKIILIPTQNLFIWSVQNIGKSNITGVDFYFSFKSRKVKGFHMFWDIKYSYLYAIDVTDPNSKTYRNQLPYIPLHNFTALFGFEFFGFGLSWNVNYGGERYALGENIEMNRLPDYVIHDLSFYYTHAFKKNTSKLKLKIDIRNILNEQYVMIKSFPMPGLNLNVKMIYEFNN